MPSLPPLCFLLVSRTRPTPWHATHEFRIAVPPISIAAVYYGRFLKKLSRKTQKSVGEMVAVSEERLGAIRTVHAFNAVEPIETSRFKEKVDKIYGLAEKEAWASGEWLLLMMIDEDRQMTSISLVSGLFYGGAGFAGNLSLIALLTYGGSLVAQGILTVGALTSLMVYTF